jgi:hypothetical protein
MDWTTSVIAIASIAMNRDVDPVRVTVLSSLVNGTIAAIFGFGYAAIETGRKSNSTREISGVGISSPV